MSNRKTPPVHRIRHGAISASIWRQESKRGPMYNATFQRAYREDETWKNSTTFGRKDLLVVGLIAARAFEWMANQPRKRQEAPPHSEDDVPY